MKREKETRRRKPIAIDVFSGCGGLSLGLRNAGFRVVAAVELNQLAGATYKANHTRTHLWTTDVRQLSAAAILQKLNLKPGELDLLAGCPPCQGFSAIRRLNRGSGFRDKRNNLIFDFLRLAEGLRPKFILLENVPGLQRNRRFNKFLAGLRELGYAVSFEVRNASDYGVPQRRQRLFVTAYPQTAVIFPPAKSVAPTVRDVIEQLPKPGRSGDRLHDLQENRSSRIQEMIRKIPRDGGSRAAAGKGYELACHKNCNGFKDVYGRMAWDTVAPTITGGCFNPSKGRFLHPTQNRAITLREASLLQGFPASYKFPKIPGKDAVALLIGNALPPKFVEAHAVEIARALREV